MTTAIRSKLIYGIIFLGLLVMACASGYNKPANDYYEEGLLFYDRMEYTRSVDSFTKVLELAPQGKDNHLVYFNRGMAYFKARQYDPSIYDYTKALELSRSYDKEFRFSTFEARANANWPFIQSTSGQNIFTTAGPGPGLAKKITTQPSPITIWLCRKIPILIWLISAVRPFGR